MWINAFLALNMPQSPLLAYWLSDLVNRNASPSCVTQAVDTEQKLKCIKIRRSTRITFLKCAQCAQQPNWLAV